MTTLNFMVYPNLEKANCERFENVKRLDAKNPPAGWEIFATQESEQYFINAWNAHHWTTSYVWDKFIPVLFHRLGLKLNQTDFKKVELEWNGMDFSHHDPVKENRYKIQSFDDDCLMEGGFEVIRDIDLDNPWHNWSFYHQMFRLAHRSGLVTNLTAKSEMRIVFNTDSMSVPVIPILINYVKEILVIDVRQSGKKYGFGDMIKKMNPSAMVNLFFDVSYFDEKKNRQIEK